MIEPIYYADNKEKVSFFLLLQLRQKRNLVLVYCVTVRTGKNNKEGEEEREFN